MYIYMFMYSVYMYEVTRTYVGVILKEKKNC